MQKRPFSAELDLMLDVFLPVLDKGFIRLVDYMGSDDSIIQAARISYGKGTKSLRSDLMLIRYLMKNKHTSPFEMCEIKLHIKAPIFVARQWLRHRTANVNEYSARYSFMDEDFYLPNSELLTTQSLDNKQGRSESTVENYELAHESMQNLSSASIKLYKELLSQHNLAKELARIILPVNFYTQFYWKIDLHNLLHFISLRYHSHAQKEIYQYAEILLNIVEKWVPTTAEAFKDYILHAKSFSKLQLEYIKTLLKQDKIKLSKLEERLSKRELQELKAYLDI